MLEIKHVPMDKSAPDLLVCPGNKHSVVFVRLEYISLGYFLFFLFFHYAFKEKNT